MKLYLISHKTDSVEIAANTRRYAIKQGIRVLRGKKIDEGFSLLEVTCEEVEQPDDPETIKAARLGIVRYNLFIHLLDEHQLILIDSEIDKILEIVKGGA